MSDYALLVLLLLILAALLAAIFFGLRKIKRKWGWKWVIILFIAAICAAIPACRWLEISAEQHKSLNNAKSLAFACRLYAGDHQDKYPARLEDLVPDYVQSLEGLEYPYAHGHGTFGYDYFGGRDDDPPGKILIQAHAPYYGMRAVVYSDMSGRLVKDTGK